MLSFTWGTETIRDLFKKKKKSVERGKHALLMSQGTPTQRGSAFVRGQQRGHRDKGLPHQEVWLWVQNQEQGDKNGCSPLKPGKGEARQLLKGSTFEERYLVLNVNAQKRAESPRLNNSVLGELLTFV